MFCSLHKYAQNRYLHVCIYVCKHSDGHWYIWKYIDLNWNLGLSIYFEMCINIYQLKYPHQVIKLLVKISINKHDVIYINQCVKIQHY